MVRKFEPIEEFQSWSGIIRRRSDINVQCVKNEETRQFWMFYGKRIKIWKKRRKTSHVIFIRARLFILKVNISSLLKNVLHSGRSNETRYLQFSNTLECRVALRIVTVIENLPKSLFNFICIATRAKLICKLQFGLARPDFFRFLMVDLMVGCSRLLVLVNDWHVIGAFEPFCSNDTKKFSSASILLGVK